MVKSRGSGPSPTVQPLASDLTSVSFLLYKMGQIVLPHSTVVRVQLGDMKNAGDKVHTVHSR